MKKLYSLLVISMIIFGCGTKSGTSEDLYTVKEDKNVFSKIQKIICTSATDVKKAEALDPMDHIVKQSATIILERRKDNEGCNANTSRTKEDVAFQADIIGTKKGGDIINNDDFINRSPKGCGNVTHNGGKVVLEDGEELSIGDISMIKGHETDRKAYFKSRYFNLDVLCVFE